MANKIFGLVSLADFQGYLEKKMYLKDEERKEKDAAKLPSIPVIIRRALSYMTGCAFDDVKVDNPNFHDSSTFSFLKDKEYFPLMSKNGKMYRGFLISFNGKTETFVGFDGALRYHRMLCHNLGLEEVSELQLELRGLEPCSSQLQGVPQLNDYEMYVDKGERRICFGRDGKMYAYPISLLSDKRQWPMVFDSYVKSFSSMGFKEVGCEEDSLFKKYGVVERKPYVFMG